MNSLISVITQFVPLLATVTAVSLVLMTVNTTLRRRWKDQPDAQFRFQLLMLTLTLAAILSVILVLPISDTLRGQLLSLIGILLSAAIALSSATFIGNLLAGIMLKTVGNARPGDFITVANLTGRITEMDLLHTEVQTEFRDLVTVPNIYMVSQPLKVVRASGSIITAEVSLGFDVPHEKVREVLRQAAEDSGLCDCFVHVRELGDFAVTYRAAGLLEDIQSLISARSKLYIAMLDALHQSNIEIVSPNFMNTRALTPETRFLPPRTLSRHASRDPAITAENVAFDKAEDAASLEKLRVAIGRIDESIKQADPDSSTHGEKEIKILESEKEQLLALLEAEQNRLKEKERLE